MNNALTTAKEEKVATIRVAYADCRKIITQVLRACGKMDYIFFDIEPLRQELILCDRLIYRHISYLTQNNSSLNKRVETVVHQIQCVRQELRAFETDANGYSILMSQNLLQCTNYLRELSEKVTQTLQAASLEALNQITFRASDWLDTIPVARADTFEQEWNQHRLRDLISARERQFRHVLGNQLVD